MKRKIGILCQFFYPEYNSSARLPFEMAEDLAKHNFQVEVFCGYPKEYSDKEKVAKKEIISGIKINRKKYLQLSRKSFFGRLLNYFSFTFVELFSLSSFRKLDVLFVYSNPPILPLVAVLAKVLFKTKLVFVAYDLYPEIPIRMGVLNNKSIIVKVMNFINNLLYKRLDQLVVLSDDMKGFVLEHRNISEDKISVIPNWEEDTTHIVNDATDSKKAIVVSYLGNMGIAQDMKTICDTILKLKNHPKVNFLLAGHGNKVDDIKNFISKNEVNNIEIKPFLKGSVFEETLSKSDVFIVSLEKGISGLAVPSKTYSYYKAGKAVVAIMDKETDIAKEIEKNQIGICVENGESDLIADFLLKNIDNHDNLSRMGIRARNLYVKNYKRNISTEKYNVMVNELIEKRN